MEDVSMSQFIAVYGSLRKGCTNHHYLHEGKYLGTDRIGGWQMYSNGSFPYVRKGDGKITTEVYEVSRETLARIDELEGYPLHYDRKIVETGHGKSWLYFVKEVPAGCIHLPDGDWIIGRTVNPTQHPRPSS